MEFVELDFVERGHSHQLAPGYKYALYPAAPVSGKTAIVRPSADWPEVAANHLLERERLVPSIGVYSIPAITVDARFWLHRDGKIVANTEILPFFYRALWQPLPSKAKRTVESAISILVPRYDEYGHFLIEVLPRLLVLHAYFGPLLPYPLLVPPDMPRYLAETLQLLFPASSKIVINPGEQVVVDRCIIASLGSLNHTYHPAIQLLLRNVVERVYGYRAPLRRRKLFISRRKYRGVGEFRILSNEEELATALARRGFEVIRPEELSFGQQVAVFSEADTIVGESGSGLHNALFSGFYTRVICINYINGVQTSIALLCGHRLDYVGPTDGLVRSYEAVAQGALGWARREYTVDVGRVEALVTS